MGGQIAPLTQDELMQKETSGTQALGITRHKYHTSIPGLSSVARAYESIDDLNLCAVATPMAASVVNRSIPC
jgi:hypothetical protein